MRGVLSVASIVLSAAVVSAGLIDSIEEAVLGLTSPADEYVSHLTETTKELMQQFSDKSESLGSIPQTAMHAWRMVLDEVPNGKEQLVKEMNKIIAASKPASSRASKSKGDRLSTMDVKADNFDIHVTDSRFPGKMLRAKSPEDLGVDDTKQYAGYLDTEEDKHFFYWFFESRNDPKNDPVVLWLNGGPGCSSLTGLFFELGPASIGPDLKPIRNKYSWNNNANVIFLDQPVNTGYSYSEGEDVSDTVTASKDVYAFLELFFKKFPEYSGRDFHIAGESYAGHYIPVFATEILSHDDRHFNLTSVLIGNYLSDPRTQYDYYEPQVCGGGAYPAVLEPEQCQEMLDKQPNCNGLIDSCYASESAWVCVPATIYCNNAMLSPYQETGLNVYDIREECGESPLCYSEMEFMEQYLNLDYVKEALGTSNIEKYEGCNFDVNANFLFNGDWMLPYHRHITELADAGIPVLSYAGDADVICNTLGVGALTEALPWYGQEEFDTTPLSKWTTKHSLKTTGKEAGTKRNFDKFTYLNIYGAGHMVPHDQPENALAMYETWLSGDYAFSG